MASEFSFTYQKGKPIITVPVQYRKNKAKHIHLLLDSGADYTILSRTDAIFLGVDYNTLSQKEETAEAANMSLIHHKKVRLYITIGTLTIQIPALVTKEPVQSLLGRKGIFDRFDITFTKDQHIVFS